VGGGGTLGYMAPELFSEDVQASKEADMYAFGMMVYEVIVGAPPFVHHKQVEPPGLTLGGSRPPRPEDPVAIGFGQGTWELTERCWDEDPKQRPTIREALEHFKGVARTSKVVEPGPTIPVDESPKAEGSSRDFCKCRDPVQFPRSDSTLAKLFVLPSRGGSSRFQQTAYASRVFVGNRVVSVPTFHATKAPGRLGRMLRRITSPKPAHRLEGSSEDGT
jgi:serine/threonine protein kinase